MKTARECALAGVDQPHWRREAQRLGVPGDAMVAGIGDLTTDVAYEIGLRDAEWCSRVDAARAEGKAEGLRMALAQLPAMKPTGEDEEDPTCSVCHCMVSVESSDDWDDGDVCYHCAVELIPKARAEIEALIAKTEAGT